MTESLALQYILIGVAIVVSAAFVVQKQWPAVVRRLRVVCALSLLREGSSQQAQTLGRLIAPRPSTTKAECGSCNSCT